MMLCDPNDNTPLSIDSSGRIVDANGNPASAFTINADEGGGIDFDYIEPEGTTLISGIAIDKDATLTITSGYYHGHGYMVANFGTVNISGGTFHSIDHGTVYWRDSEANISGGHFITDSKSYAAVYSNGRSLEDGYSYWIHDNGEPLETLDVYNPSYSGYIHNLTTQAVSRNVSVEKQSLQVRVTADGKDLLFDSVAEALKEGQNYESATVTFVGNGDVIGCRDYGIMYGSNISVYGGRFKGLAHRPAVTLHDGLLLCGGRYSCDSGQSAIAYPGERIYESWWRFIGEGYPPRDYYSGERLEMEVDRNDNGRVVFYTDSTQTAYANDIYLSMSPIFQIQHLTHLIDEAKHGRASVSDIQKMVSKVLKK